MGSPFSSTIKTSSHDLALIREKKVMNKETLQDNMCMKGTLYSSSWHLAKHLQRQLIYQVLVPQT